MSAVSMKSTYKDKLFYKGYKWDINTETTAGMFSVSQLHEICESCDSIIRNENRSLREENTKLKKLVTFYRKEIHLLELKTVDDSKAVPLKDMVDRLTSTQSGKQAWEDAWEKRKDEWKILVKQGEMSKVKYHRLLNGIDQRALAEKLGTVQPNISRIEKPGYNVPAKTLIKLATIFGAKMEDLIGD